MKQLSVSEISCPSSPGLTIAFMKEEKLILRLTSVQKCAWKADKTMHISRLLGDPAVRFMIAGYGEILQERIRQKKKIAKDIRSVVAEIDHELNK